MALTRRALLWNGALGVTAFLAPGLPRFARATPAQDRTLVVLFLRGGADGINLIIPRGDQVNYVARRTSNGQDLTIPAGGPALQLDGFFELHPALAPLKPLYDAGDLCAMHAVGGTNDYSHFTAMDAMERAEPANPALVNEGWLHRALEVMFGDNCLDGPVLSLHGVALGSTTPKSLAGITPQTHLATPSIAEFDLRGPFAAERGTALERIYGLASHPLISDVGASALAARNQLDAIAEQPPGAVYPPGDGRLNAAFQDAARLIKNPSIRTKVITVDYGGWDHHDNEAPRLETNAERLASAMAAFWADLGSATSRTTLLVMSEFGRTAHSNGTAGTDHGWGSIMLALGGPVQGGRVLTRADAGAPGTGLPTPTGHWPGLALNELHVQSTSGEQRDLKATTDFRDVFGDVLTNFLNLPAIDVQNFVLRGYAPAVPGLF